jgi:hypothetical protein
MLLLSCTLDANTMDVKRIFGYVIDSLRAIIDLWCMLQSLGVVLYILVSGGFPFPGNSMDKLKRAVLSGQVKIPYWVSVGMWIGALEMVTKSLQNVRI